MKSQWYSRKELEELQLRKLRKLIRHAYDNVPYYHNAFHRRGLTPGDIKNISDLGRLPMLTKEDVRNNFEDLKARNIKEIVLQRTSGSSGVPIKFHLDARSAGMESAFVWRHWNWAGYKFRDRSVLIRGQWKFPEGCLWYQDTGGKNLIMSSRQLIPENIEKYIQKIRDFDPSVIRAFPSTAYVLAQYMREKGVTDIRPKCIITSSETLFTDHRALIEEQFGCDVYDWYGLAERVAAIGQCSEGNYHINSEYGIVEIMKDGRHASEGERGEIVATGLNNYAMPLIRYGTQDIAVPSNRRCPCGRGLPLIGSIEGRVQDIVVTPTGRYIYPVFIPYLFYLDPDNYSGSSIRGIREYQVVQEAIDRIVIRIAKEPGYTIEDFDYIRENFRKFVEGVHIEFEFVEKVIRGETGKRRLVISKLQTERGQ